MTTHEHSAYGAEAVCCPYCENVAVELEDPGFEGEGGGPFEGDCGACGRHVTWDYNPTGVVAYVDGCPTYERPR